MRLPQRVDLRHRAYADLFYRRARSTPLSDIDEWALASCSPNGAVFVTRNSLRFSVAVVSATLLLGALGPMRASGTTLDDKKAQAEQLQNQIDENGNKIAALGEEYNGAVYDYEKAQAAVSEAKQRLAVAQAAQEKLSTQVAERGAVLYQGAQDPSSIFPDTNISSINELGARTKYGAVATGNDEQLIANLERAQQDLDLQRKEYEQQVNAAAKKRDSIAAARAQVEQASAQEQELLSQVKGEIATLIAEEKAREAAALRASLLAIADSNSSSGAGSRVPASDVGGDAIPTLPAPSPRAAAAISYAEAQLGKPYRYAAAGPDAYDCSGLTMMAWAAAGVSMPHYSGAQYAMFPHVPLDQLEPGDLLFWGPGGSEHVAMYIGGGLQIAATHTGDYVRIQSMGSDPVGAARPG
jgi:peptidoglycan DL-endopeptidase CwlO